MISVDFNVLCHTRVASSRGLCGVLEHRRVSVASPLDAVGYPLDAVGYPLDSVASPRYPRDGVHFVHAQNTHMARRSRILVHRAWCRSAVHGRSFRRRRLHGDLAGSVRFAVKS